MSESNNQPNAAAEKPAEQAEAEKASRPGNKRRSYKGPLGRLEKLFCYIGLLLLRKLRFLRRRALAALQALLKVAVGAKNRILYIIKLVMVRNGVSFDFVTDLLQSIRRGNAAAKKKGFWAQLCYWMAVVAAVLIRLIMKIAGSLNYVAPVAAAAVFVFVVNSALNVTYALKVVYNGEEIGYIADEAVFEQAERQMLGRIVFEDYIKPEDNIPEFTVAAVNRDQILDEDALTDELIKASGNELSQATGLYIEDEFVGAVMDRPQLIRLLDSMKDRYRSPEEEDSFERVEFVKDVDPRDGLYPVTSVMDIDDMEQRINREVEGEKIYITVAGDAPILIAQKNGVPYSQIKALNPGIEEKLLIGQEVLVKKSVPLLEVKVVKTVTEEEEINFKIEQIQDPNRYQGYVSVTQRGKKGTSLVTSEVTYIDGYEVGRTVLDTRVITEPVTEKVVVGGKFPLQQLPSSAMESSGSFIWPTASGYVSCGFYGYWGHTGMDIASSTGTAIYAAASGTVTKVAYNTTGYGYHIIINHGGGAETLYAHNSKLHVKVGQWVNQGQLIASMGRTGRSTGTHLHFEVRSNGKYLNPANYVGTRCPY